MHTQLHNTILLVTDQQRSVLNFLDKHQPHPIAYTSYGHRPRKNDLLTLLGFNGELSDPLTGHYFLGNGYRLFNPVLMRFHSPDSWCPFGKGGLNAYAYCLGNPVNLTDQTGHSPFFTRMAKGFANRFLGRTPSRSANSATIAADLPSSTLTGSSRTSSAQSLTHPNQASLPSYDDASHLPSFAEDELIQTTDTKISLFKDKISNLKQQDTKRISAETMHHYNGRLMDLQRIRDDVLLPPSQRVHPMNAHQMTQLTKTIRAYN